MRQTVAVALVLSLSGFSSASAQSAVGAGMAAPIGIISPLGIGPGAPVAATGIPLGATELATPGVSPTASSSSPLGSMTTATTTACSATPGAMQTPSTDEDTS